MDVDGGAGLEMSGTIGIDLGGSRIKAAILDYSGSTLQQVVEPVASQVDYEAILVQLTSIVNELRKSDRHEIAGIGLGVAGLLDKACNTIMTSPNIPALNGRCIAQDLENKTGLRVVMDNDANLMAIGEGRMGGARGFSHYIAITLGTGVGGAIISDGKLLKGFNGGGGEIGHILVNPDGPRCNCGSQGCLEAYVGQIGIKKYYSAKYPRFIGLGLKELNQKAIEGDEEAREVFAHAGVILGAALAGLVNILNPECIVIGGGVAAADDFLFIPLRKEIERRAFKIYLDGLQIRKAELGNWAGVVGAGLIAQKACL